MKKIIYPIDNNFETKYSDLILSKNMNLIVIENLLKEYNINKTFKELLVLPIEELIKVPKIDIFQIKANNPNLNSDELKSEKKKIDEIFDYKGFQKDKLSNFFMSNFPKSKACYYCNLDFINTFIDFKNEYKNKFDLINNHESIEELKLIDGIGEIFANEIIKLKGKIINEVDFNFFFKGNVKNVLNELFELDGSIKFDKIKTHNHFTLDHILPQKDYPHLSLSLYNLVPCCSPCNSKFKGKIDLQDDINDLINVAPTSKDFDLDILTSFDILFNIGYDSINLPYNIDEYKIKLNSKYKKYIETLKLQGRFNFHKNISFDLIEKRKMYSDSQLNEIEKIFFDNNIFMDKETLKKQIFGSIIFEKEDMNEPFEKYKKDIAKQLGLI